MISKAEKEYYEKMFKDNANNLKNSWRLLKQIINKNKSSTSSSKFVIDNVITTNKKNSECF